MKYFVTFSLLFILGFGDVSDARSKGLTNSFIFPYQRPASKSPFIRIVGGDQAYPNQFPYQVGMYVTKQLEQTFCGGSVISANYVLTAAHCVEGAISVDLIFGAQNISSNTESTRQRQTSTSYTIHPGWDRSTLTNDIAIIKLSTPLTLNKYVQTIKLASGSDTYAGNQGTIIGWGITSDSQRAVTDILRYASNTILSNDQCKAAGSDYSAIIQPVHICLSGEGKKSICQGDSGGPLTTNGIQVGITSFSYQSCEASKPSVFVRLTQFTDWIKANSDVNL